MFFFPQAQEDLRLAKTTGVSADLNQAEMTIQQMSAEIEALMEKLKVGVLNVTEDMILMTLLKVSAPVNNSGFCRSRRRRRSQTDRWRREGFLTWRVLLRA